MAYTYITQPYSAGVVSLVLPEINSIANTLIHDGSFIKIEHTSVKKITYIRTDSVYKQTSIGKGTGEPITVDINVTGSAYVYTYGTSLSDPINLEAYKYYTARFIVTENTSNPYDDPDDIEIINEQDFANTFTNLFNLFGFDTSADPLPSWARECVYVYKPSSNAFASLNTLMSADVNNIKMRITFMISINSVNQQLNLWRSEDGSIGFWRTGNNTSALYFSFSGSTLMLDNVIVSRSNDGGIITATAEAKNGNITFSVDANGIHETITGTYTYTQSTSPLYLFGIPSTRNDSDHNVSPQIMRVEMWKSGVKVLDMIPATLNGHYMYEYLIFSGTQYITIPQISATNKVRIEIGLLPNPQTSQPTFIGVAGQALQLYHNSTNLLLWYRDASNISHSATIGAFDTSKVNNLSLEFTSSGMTYKLNDNAANTVSSSVLFNLITGGNILLGLYGSSTYDYNFYGNIYYFRIYCDNVPVRYMVPVTKAAGNIKGMYDEITSTLFENSGTGSFTNANQIVGLYDSFSQLILTADTGRLTAMS